MRHGQNCGRSLYPTHPGYPLPQQQQLLMLAVAALVVVVVVVVVVVIQRVVEGQGGVACPRRL